MLNRAYRFRIYPKAKQVARMEETLDLCRRLYNSALEHRITTYRNGQPATYLQQQNELPQIKKALPEYAQVHSQVLQDALRRLDRAYKGFFKRIVERKNGGNAKVGFPRFKGANRYDSVTYPQSGFRLLPNGHLLLSRIGEIRMFMHRRPRGKVKTLNVKRDRCGDWFAVLTAERPKARKRNAQTVGVDLGLRSLITLSDGGKVAPPKFLRQSEDRLRLLQRRVSRTKKGSARRRKAVLRLAKEHRRIERRRTDFLHKLSHSLAKNNVVFENLNVAGMLKNHCLSKSVADASWSRLVRFTACKAEDAGRLVVLVDPKCTSQECSVCHARTKLRLTDRTFRCPRCGLVVCRDVNAARVILGRVGRGTAEFTPVENPPLPMASGFVEPGSPRALAVGGCHGLEGNSTQ